MGLKEAPATLTRGLVKLIDALLCAALRVEEFSQREDCILRIALRKADRRLQLPEGVTIQSGETFGELHLWNEHLPQLKDYSSELAWAAQAIRLMEESLRELAKYVETDLRFAQIQGFRGESSIGLKGKRKLAERPLLRLGFVRIPEENPRPGPGRRFAEFWQNLYALGLIWTFHPDIIRGKSIWQLERLKIWMSRDTLMSRYGSGSREAEPPS